MSEPTSSALAGIAGFKAIGGHAVAAAGGAGLAAIVVMCMTPPRNKREWVVAIISTVMGSIGGGAVVIEYLGLQKWAESTNGLAALIGVAFACGLPAWMVVRWTFSWMERRKDKDLGEVIGDVRNTISGNQNGGPQ